MVGLTIELISVDLESLALSNVKKKKNLNFKVGVETIKQPCVKTKGAVKVGNIVSSTGET